MIILTSFALFTYNYLLYHFFRILRFIRSLLFIQLGTLSIFSNDLLAKHFFQQVSHYIVITNSKVYRFIYWPQS